MKDRRIEPDRLPAARNYDRNDACKRPDTQPPERIIFRISKICRPAGFAETTFQGFSGALRECGALRIFRLKHSYIAVRPATLDTTTLAN
jgi:hypothetical protein